jgi:uncharacterized protein with HEPN domain
VDESADGPAPRPDWTAGRRNECRATGRLRRPCHCYERCGAGRASAHAVNATVALEYARLHPGRRGDGLVTDAIATRVEEVAESAKTRFPRALRADHADIPWDEIAGMRDRLADDYGNLDVAILREIVAAYLPRLVRSIDQILGPE